MDLNDIPAYLSNPSQIQVAIDLLESRSSELPILEFYTLFESALKIETGDSFPITAIQIDGPTCRARLHDDLFIQANNINQIGIKQTDISQGRCNPAGIPIFYGSNSKKTSAFEVLQDSPIGDYEVTLGFWECAGTLRIVNFVDGSDNDFSKIPFVHSLPKEYLKDWPEAPRKSASLILDYFNKKFKMTRHTNLYNITNVIAGICFSLKDIDGLGYAAVSSNFEGFNIALKDPSKLRCVDVERWFVRKYDNAEFDAKCIKKGIVDAQGNITW